MTNKEKAIMLKDTIVILYENEGRPKTYISKLLGIDRKVLTDMINNEWKLVQGKKRHLTPSNQKFLNKNKALIKSRLDRNVTMTDIAKELGIGSEYLRRTIIPQDEVLSKARDDYFARIKKEAEEKREQSQEKFNFEALEGEEWREIMGYDGYFISNHGRVKSYKKSYDAFQLLKTYPNINNDRLYIYIDKKGLQISRLVGHSFVDGYTEKNNTINHKDLDVQNNYYKNLEWVSQSRNNKHAYENGRNKSVGYTRNGKFKKIILNDKYEFKTITALATFLGKSETQVQRYINGETKTPHKITFIY